MDNHKWKLLWKKLCAVAAASAAAQAPSHTPIEGIYIPNYIYIFMF